MSDSVYKEAVTKLKILLSATEHPTMRIGDLKQSRQDKSKSLDQLFTGERGCEEVKPSQGTPRREPLFTRLPPRQSNSSVRRQLFGGGEKLRGRHNSWHSLTQAGPGEEGREGEGEEVLRRPQSSSLINLQPGQVRPASPAVRELVSRQEVYIEQLEREAAFCKEQLSTILGQVRDVLLTNTSQEQTNKEEMLQLIKNIEQTVKSTEASREAQSSGAGEEVRKVREELEVVRLREAEAAEQVQRSIKVAEQIKQQKTEAEFEISQLTGQVERQQQRIRALIEEQVSKVEEERGEQGRGIFHSQSFTFQSP